MFRRGKTYFAGTDYVFHSREIYTYCTKYASMVSFSLQD